MGLNKECLNIIMEKSELADESLAQFFVACFRCLGSYEDQVDMVEALYASVVPELGGLKNVFDIITNDERYFKWDDLDRFNKQSAVEPNDYWALKNLYCQIWFSDTPGLVEDRMTLPDVDFLTYPYILTTRNALPKALPCIGKGYYLKDVRGKSFPKDLYTGVIVSRSLYPDATITDVDKHEAIILHEKKPLGESSICQCSTKLNRITSNTKYVNYIEYDDPGLIYIPVKSQVKAFIPFLDKINKPCFRFDTCLPKHILDKYNLPVGDLK